MNNQQNINSKWLNHPWTNGVGLAILAVVLITGGAGWGFIILAALFAAVMEWIFQFRNPGPFSPYRLMAASPLLLINYSSLTDFRIRSLCFILIAYIIAAAVRNAPQWVKFSLNQKSPLFIWLISFLVPALASFVLYQQGVQLSGDEPHYLMIAQSVVNDGDFDLKNNFEEKSYLEYIPVEVKFHGGDYNGKYLSFHLPGVSFLLIPFYWLYKVLGGPLPAALYFRLVAALLNAFFMTVLFYLLRLSLNGKDVTRLWLFFLTTFPLLFHCIHLFPELPAAALTAAGYLRFRSCRPNLLLTGLLLAPVPWFHVKYIPLLAVLAGAIIFDALKPFRNFRLRGEKIRRILLLFFFPAVSLALLVWYSKGNYGVWSPTGIFPRESYWSVPFLLRIKVFFSYFLDQRDGLLFYAPLFILAFWAMRRKFTHRGLLAGLCLAYAGFHAFTSVRGAYSPAGRPLIYISWILCIWVARYYQDNVAESPQWLSRFAFRFLAGLSFFIPVWLFYYPQFMYQPVFSYTQEGASGLSLFFGGSIPLEKVLPSFLTAPRDIHWANFVWLGVLAAGWLFYVLRPLKRVEIPAPRWLKNGAPLTLFIVMVFIFCLYPHVRFLPQGRYGEAKWPFYNNSRNFQYQQEGDRYRMKAGGRYELFLDPAARFRGKLALSFLADGSGAGVIVRSGKHLLMETKAGDEALRVEITPEQLSEVRIPGSHALHLEIEIPCSGAECKNGFVWLKME